MLSAKDGEYDPGGNAFDIGADDYLTKTVLLRGPRGAAACPCCGGGAPERPNRVDRGGHCRWIPARRRVTRRPDRADPDLPREYGVLEFLLRHNGRCGLQVRKSFGRCGIRTTKATTNVVEVYIGYLRRKIDVPFGVVTIENRTRRRLPTPKRFPGLII